MAEAAKKHYVQDNEVRIVGNLVRDPAEGFRKTQSGKSVVNFTIAQNALNDGVNYFDVVAWNRDAENVANYKKKGDEVEVVGRLENNNYEANDGTMRYKIRIVARRVKFLRNAKGSPQNAPESNTPDEDFNDIPEFGEQQAA